MMAKWLTGRGEREGEEGHIEWRSPGLISIQCASHCYYLADRQSYRKRCTTVCLDSLCRRRRVPICPAQCTVARCVANRKWSCCCCCRSVHLAPSLPFFPIYLSLFLPFNSAVVVVWFQFALSLPLHSLNSPSPLPPSSHHCIESLISNCITLDSLSWMDAPTEAELQLPFLWPIAMAAALPSSFFSRH